MQCRIRNLSMVDLRLVPGFTTIYNFALGGKVCTCADNGPSLQLEVSSHDEQEGHGG